MNADRQPAPSPQTVPPSSGGRLGVPLKRLRSIGRWAARVALAVIVVAAFFFSVFPNGRAAVRGALLVPALVTAQQPLPLRLLGEPIQHASKTVSSKGGPVYLDVYTPTTAAPPVPGTREGVVIIPGVSDNRKSEQLVNLAETIARSGLVAMTMTTPSLIGNTLTPADGDAVVEAVLALGREPGVDHRRVGILSFSAAGGPASYAAADPRIRDSLAFLVCFGSHFEAQSLLRAVGGRAIVADDRAEPWKPEPITLEVLANTVATTLSTGPANLLRQGFRRGGQPLTPEQLASLPPEAAAAYHLLAGDQPDRVDANLVALSPAMRELLVALSPSAVVGAIRAPIYLLHDHNDKFVPFTESRHFADALERLHHPHEVVLFDIFQHAEVRTGLNLGQVAGDAATLFRIVVALLLPAS